MKRQSLIIALLIIAGAAGYMYATTGTVSPVSIAAAALGASGGTLLGASIRRRMDKKRAPQSQAKGQKSKKAASKGGKKSGKK